MNAAGQRHLLRTETGEPFQPIRLTYRIDDAAAVAEALSGLGRLDHATIAPGEQTLAVSARSLQRAVDAARFLAPRFGAAAVLSRVRMVNRWFDASEAAAGLDHLDAMLDAGVTVVDSPEEKRKRKEARAAARSDLDEVLAVDVPLLEDFPLVPEEETPALDDLRFQLNVRYARAEEHWRGNADVTLGAVLYRLVAEVTEEGP